MEEQRNYNQAIERLQAIVQALNSNTPNIDDLANQLKEAQSLLTFCREKLTQTEKSVQEILTQE